MVKAFLKGFFLLVFLCSIMLSACRQSTPSANVIIGNMAYNQGQYQKSILHYLSAEHKVDREMDVVYYNLANVYYALGEVEAALRTWTMAEEVTNDVEILYRIAFNRGILYYNWGRYDEAYRNFRRALVLKPADIDSKVNLEESLSRIRTEINQPLSADEKSEKQFIEGNNLLMDYLKRKEADEWISRESEFKEQPRDW